MFALGLGWTALLRLRTGQLLSFSHNTLTEDPVAVWCVQSLRREWGREKVGPGSREIPTCNP